MGKIESFEGLKVWQLAQTNLRLHILLEKLWIKGRKVY